MFNPIPPGSNPQPPGPAPGADEPELQDPDETAEGEEPLDDDISSLKRPHLWPAVTRWSRLCRVLAFVSLVIFGWMAATSLYQALTFEPEFDPFMRPRPTPGLLFWFALLYLIAAVASCISLLGFAELLHLFIAIEAAGRRPVDRTPPRDQRDADENEADEQEGEEESPADRPAY